jgi:hypothetical protein
MAKRKKLKLNKIHILFIIGLIAAFSTGFFSNSMVIAQSLPPVWHGAEEIIEGTFPGNILSKWDFPGTVYLNFLTMKVIEVGAQGGSISLSDIDGSGYWRLSVFGDATTEYLAIMTPLVADPLIISRTGDVGIGTFNPVYKLDVDGNTRITGDAFIGGAGQNRKPCLKGGVDCPDVNCKTDLVQPGIPVTYVSTNGCAAARTLTGGGCGCAGSSNQIVSSSPGPPPDYDKWYCQCSNPSQINTAYQICCKL